MQRVRDVWKRMGSAWRPGAVVAYWKTVCGARTERRHPGPMHARMLPAMMGLLALYAVLAGPARAYEKDTLLITNAQGTVVAQVDTGGNVTYQAAYRPYGKQQTGAPQAGPGYTGHVNDPGTGLVYMQQRYYDPGVGRFLSPDPIGPAAGNAFNFNRYAYANDNPVRYTDPDGRCPDGMCGQMLGAHVKWRMTHPNAPADGLEKAAVVGVGAMLSASGLSAVVEIAGGGRVLNKLLSDSSSTPKLTDEQSKNLARFEKKFSKQNRNVQVSQGKDGTITMKNDVPGKVPGSKAVYKKTVDSSGKTTSAIKTTYDPKGKVVHVKDKLNQ